MADLSKEEREALADIMQSSNDAEAQSRLGLMVEALREMRAREGDVLRVQRNLVVQIDLSVELLRLLRDPQVPEALRRQALDACMRALATP